MLGIHRAGPGRADYYLSDLAPELPSPVPGRWEGAAAQGLGLAGTVASAEFRPLLEGRHPGTSRAMASGRATVAAFDLTFSTPKSISVLYALGGAEVARAVVAAHREAVNSSLRYLERHALTAVRRSRSSPTVMPTTGAAAAVFTHGVSRSLDPHVHSHVVLANLVHGADGRWSTVDQRGLFAHRQAASAVYDADLRAGLTTALDARWVRTPSDALELAGVPLQLMAAFSTRQADIRLRRHEAGVRSRRGERIAWAATRPQKVQGPVYADLQERWAERARDVVAQPFVLDDALGQVMAPASLDEHRYAATISLTPHGGAHRRDVVAAFGASARDGLEEETLDSFVREWVPRQPDGAVGVAEPLHRRRDVLPENHLLRALGPRPATHRDHQLWLGAARMIDAYRERWGVQDMAEPLGLDAAAALAGLPGRRLADHVRTARHVDAVRVRLGHRAPLTAELGLAR